MDIQRLSENRVKCTFTKDELLYEYGIDMTQSPEETKRTFRENIHQLSTDVLEELDIKIEGDMRVSANIMPTRDGKVDLYLSFSTDDMPLPPISPIDILGQIFGKFMQPPQNDMQENEEDTADTTESAKNLAKMFESGEKIENPFIEEAVIYKFDNFQMVINFVNMLGKQEIDSALFKSEGKYFLRLSKYTKGIDALASEFFVKTDSINDAFLNEHAQTIISDKALETIQSI